MNTMTLTDFLRARLADDEALARLQGESMSTVDASAWPRVEALYGRVLADCEAKRRIIEMHTSADGKCETCWIHAEGVADNPDHCPTVRAVAAVYADHPDYRPEWRP